ncbi:MAG: hypothetical protein JSR82_21135 [Verrucomicrobia bacterium]|nr:hypothetical protein [Verrucomicrobiota bacterium]
MANSEPEFHGAPFIRAWSPPEYGGHAQNWAVHQAANGLIYVANNRGLLEFDGATWRLLPLPDGAVPRTILSDAQGRIWVGAAGTICVLEPDGNGKLQARSVTSELQVEGGSLGTFFWSQAEEGGRALLFAADTVVVRVREDKKAEILSAGVQVRLYTWEGGTPLLQLGQRPKLSSFLVRQGRLVAAPELDGLRFAHSQPDGEGGLMLFGLNEWSRWRGGQESTRQRIPGLAENDSVRGAVALDGGRRFALATLRGGVVVVGPDGRWLERWSRADGLPDNTVRALGADRQGGLWLALNNGLARLQVASAIRAVAPGRGVDQSVTALAGDVGGRLWIGGPQGVQVRGPGEARFAARDDLPSDVFGLASLADDELLVAGRGLQSVRDGRALPTVVDRTTAATGVPLLLRGGRIAAVPSVQGVGLYTRQGEGWSERIPLRGVQGVVQTLALGDDDWLWLVRDGREVLRVRAEGESILTATAEPLGAAAGADPARLLRAKVVRWGGAIWLVDEGLKRWEAALGRFVEPPEIPAEWRSPVYQRPFALPDGSLWLQRRLDEDETSLGLVRLAWANGRVNAQEWNLPWVTRLNPQALRLEADASALWIGGYGGLVRLALADTPGHETSAPVAQIRRVASGGREIFGGSRSASAETRQLAVGQQALRFEFGAPWFLTDQRGTSPLRWRSRLVGFDEQWSEWSAEPRRDYTNLPAGDYVFQLQARAWGEAGPVDAFFFRLPPPWWGTWWARSLQAAAVVGLIVLLTRELSQRALRNRIARLEAAAGIDRERLRIARDMHDDLGSLLGRVALLSERGLEQLDDRAAASETLRRIRETAQALSAATRDIVWAVNPQNDTLEGTLDHLALWVETALGEAGVRCFVDLPTAIPLRQLGSQRRHALLLAIREATQNLLKYAGAREAHFTASLDAGGTLTLVLRDDGRGFAPGEVHGTGYGLQSIAARLSSIGGSARVESQPGQGTTVTLILPP